MLSGLDSAGLNRRYLMSFSDAFWAFGFMPVELGGYSPILQDGPSVKRPTAGSFIRDRRSR